jgi:predicted peptidase
MCVKQNNFLFLLLICLVACTKEQTAPSFQQSITTSQISDSHYDIVGRQRLVTCPTGDATYPTTEALLWLPQGYGDNDSSYPLIINLYGQGQCGTDINTMLEDKTMSAYIANGFDPVGYNKNEQKTYEYIIFSPQCPVAWGWSAPQVKVMLATLKDSLRIDNSRVYLTGFSAGGWGLWSCITDDESLCSQFAAIAPISSAAADHPDLITNVDKYGIACWNICGDQDAFYPNAVSYTNIINDNNPIYKAELTSLQGVGHSAWEQAYDNNWEDNEMNTNLYDWLIEYKR